MPSVGIDLFNMNHLLAAVMLDNAMLKDVYFRNSWLRIALNNGGSDRLCCDLETDVTGYVFPGNFKLAINGIKTQRAGHPPVRKQHPESRVFARSRVP